jgi:hypothetical protein
MIGSSINKNHCEVVYPTTSKVVYNFSLKACGECNEICRKTYKLLGGSLTQQLKTSIQFLLPKIHKQTMKH